MKALIIVTAVCLLIIGSALGGYSIARASQVVYVNPGSLNNHGCDDSEWHFIVTQVSDPSLAPPEIHVVWVNGEEADVPLDGVTGQAAHYYDYSNLNSPVENAWMSIYDAWSGTFNLSHGPCFDDPTPTPTEVQSATPTNTPTGTASPTSTSTATATSTSSPTSTSTGTPTEDPNTPTPTATGTQPTATETPMPTKTPFITLTPDPTETPYPPIPDEADEASGYPGVEMGTLTINGVEYKLWLGTNAEDGSLLLPSNEKGAALYLKTIWMHRAWRSGWVQIRTGDIIEFRKVDAFGGFIGRYKVVDVTQIDYGIYPKTDSFGEVFQYIATCYSNNDGQWIGVELFKIRPIEKGEMK
jgi:hypothetical protein